MNPTAAPYQLHGFEVSYFTAKVRPALRYKQLWYEERRANIRWILKQTGLAFIPIVVSPDGEIWQDSTDIYERLEAAHPDPPLFPGSGLQRLVAHLVELYADEFALLPAMHYRWGSELGDASARARFVAMTGSAEQGKRAGDQMAAGRLMIGANDETAPAIEAHMRESLDALSTHFEAHPYLMGDRQSFADCALMGPFYGHYFNDLVSRKLLLETALPCVGWIERCNYPNTDEQGEWLPGDEIAATLREALGAMGRDAAPVILDLVSAIEDWADSRPADARELPRAVGKCATSLRGIPFERGALGYTLLSVQRVVDAYRALGEPDRKRADENLAGTGWEAVLAYEPRHRLTRDGYQLVFE